MTGLNGHGGGGQTMLEIPKDSNPIADPDGTYFREFKQPADIENVWFISGSLNEDDRIRKIDVKRGKAIFGPIVNYICCKNPGFGKSNLYSTSQGSTLEQEAAEDIDKCDFGVEFTGHVSEMMRDRRTNSEMACKFFGNACYGRLVWNC